MTVGEVGARVATTSEAGPWIRPPALRPGGCIGIVAPAGPPDRAAIDVGVAALRARGFECRVGDHVFAQNGLFAGTDADRAADLAAMLSDPEIGAVVCARGGYGSTRLLPLWDPGFLAARPKALVGFSDITALHAACARFGLVSFHGAMVADLSLEGAGATNLDALLRALCDPAPLGTPPWPAECTPRVLCPGTARGRIVGGNLSLLAATLGTPWELDTAGRLLLLEDTHEPAYSLDRYLVQLTQAGKLAAAAGFLIGELAKCGAPPGGGEPLSVFAEHLVPLGKACVAGLPLGHGVVRWTLPLGVEAVLDTAGGGLCIVESAVAAG